MGKTYEEVKVGAITFANAAKALGVIGEAGLAQLKEESAYKLLAQTMIPAITLKAFSIELALKALVVKNGKNYGNLHELNKLYIEISEDDRDKIKRNVVSQMKIVDANYNDTKFQEDLDAISRTFIDWRYFYEDTRTVNGKFLNVLFDYMIEFL